MKLVFSDMEEIPNGGIFLAGPTRRNSKYNASWRKVAVDLFEKEQYNGILYIPEYGTTESFEDSLTNIHKQTDWEWEALDKASVIMFWIPRDIEELPGFTTNVEFGRYTALVPEKIVLGYPENARKMRYLDYLYTKSCNKVAKHSLEETVLETVTLFKQNNPYFTIDLNNYDYTDDDFREFQEQGGCMGCGTQRCLGTIETLHEAGPCGTFKHYLEKKKNNRLLNIQNCF